MPNEQQESHREEASPEAIDPEMPNSSRPLNQEKAPEEAQPSLVQDAAIGGDHEPPVPQETEEQAAAAAATNKPEAEEANNAAVVEPEIKEEKPDENAKADPSKVSDEKVLSAEEKRQQVIDAIENDMKSEGMCGKNCGWISMSMLAGFCMGTGAFVFASGYS